MVRVHREQVSWILILFTVNLYSGVFQQSSASSAQCWFHETSGGESPPETRWKQCKTPLANSAGSVCLFNLQKSRIIAEAPRTQCHSALASRRLNWDFFLLFAVIHILSQEQAFGLMTYSLIRVLGGSPRHRDYKELGRKFQ